MDLEGTLKSPKEKEEKKSSGESAQTGTIGYFPSTFT